MKVKKIFIASVLKPVDDVRHCHKLAYSLAKANKYQIFILGKGTQKKSPIKNITFVPLGLYHRLSIRRLLSQFLFVSQALKLKPHLVLLTTPELLPVAVLLKKWLRYKLVLDLQENYFKNIQYQVEYSRPQRWIGLKLIRFLQGFFNHLDHLLLAERSYLDEVDFDRAKMTVLENKALFDPAIPRATKWSAGQPLKLVFSGTISHYSGVLRSITLFEKLIAHYPETSLTIIGAYHDEKLARQLQKIQTAYPRITLHISEHPVPHKKIIEILSQSHLGIIGYLPDHVNQNRVPTKLFEYASLGLPYLIADHPYWNARGAELGGAISVNFDKIESDYLLDRLQTLETWDSTPSIWNEETSIFLSVINSLIKET